MRLLEDNILFNDSMRERVNEDKKNKWNLSWFTDDPDLSRTHIYRRVESYQGDYIYRYIYILRNGKIANEKTDFGSFLSETIESNIILPIQL